MAPPTTTSRPGRLLAALAVLIVILLTGVLGGALSQPSGWHKRFKVGLGLDLSSGTTADLKAVTPKGTSSNALQNDLNTAVSIMISRVNGAGFNGATIVPQPPNIINVTVPGKNAQQVVNLVGTTAQLRFRQVLLVAPNETTGTPTPTPSASPSPAPGSTTKAATPSPSKSSSTPAQSTTADGAGNASLLTAQTKADFNRLNCSDKNWKTQIYGNSGNADLKYDNVNSQVVACYEQPGSGLMEKFALDKSTVTGEMLKLGGSSATLQTSGDWYVNLTFNSQGAKAFGALSTKMYDNFYSANAQTQQPQDDFAIVLDGTPVAVPYMADVLDDGKAQIQGTFTQKQADNLANVLNYGALPLTFHTISVESVSAQLGATQLHAGLLAGLVGLLLVVIYAFLYYRGLGIVAISSLAIAALLSYLTVVLLSDYESFAMSLAGIAGLIVAIGITADSFVVYFERLRDEVREGKSLRTAVERGWQRARRTILVSDTVSFIAAAVLYKFAVTDVQNFAFTLGLTTIVDVVVVFLFTKPMISILARTRFFGQGHKLSGLDPARLGRPSPWRGGSRHPAPWPEPGGPRASAPATTRPRTDPKEA